MLVAMLMGGSLSCEKTPESEYAQRFEGLTLGQLVMNLDYDVTEWSDDKVYFNYNNAAFVADLDTNWIITNVRLQ